MLKSASDMNERKAANGKDVTDAVDIDPRKRIEAIWTSIRNDGYAVVRASESPFEHGLLGSGFRGYVSQEYFKGGKLQPEKYTDVFPPNRERARDVVRYRWRNDTLLLEEHDTVAIGSRSYDPKSRVREYPRIETLADPVFSGFIEKAISLIPPEVRQEQGTFGVNLFRTYSDVVSGAHKDDEEFVLVYVADKHAGGAVTSLYKENDANPVTTVTLNPGDFILFDDRRFLHETTELQPLDDTQQFRDTIICTINKPETYPLD